MKSRIHLIAMSPSALDYLISFAQEKAKKNPTVPEFQEILDQLLDAKESSVIDWIESESSFEDEEMLDEIDTEELIDYVENHTGYDREVIEEILNAVEEYLEGKEV